MKVSDQFTAQGPGFVLEAGDSLEVVSGDVLVLPVGEDAKYRVNASTVSVVERETRRTV